MGSLSDDRRSTLKIFLLVPCAHRAGLGRSGELQALTWPINCGLSVILSAWQCRAAFLEMQTLTEAMDDCAPRLNVALFRNCASAFHSRTMGRADCELPSLLWYPSLIYPGQDSIIRFKQLFASLIQFTLLFRVRGHLWRQ